jgi:CubicO group peptidase (beta-lactamase class C family)
MRNQLIIGILSAGASLAIGQELPLAEPESVGMSTQRLGRIGEVLNGFVEAREVPGFVSLVARKGRIVHLEAHGRREMHSDEPMPKDAVFEMASMTKPITAVSAMMLYEEGRFTINEPISNHLPHFKNPRVVAGPNKTVSAEREITTHDLLRHTSGVKDPRTRIEQFSYATLAEHMHDLAEEPLKSQPGSQWLYGDSYDVLGYLVEVVSGQRLDRFWQERIFDPLGMSDTHYWLPPDKEVRRAVLWNHLRDGNSDPDMSSRYPAVAAERRTYFAGASGLHMTAVDYWRFCQMLLNGGQFNGVQLLSPKTVEWMTINHIGEAMPGWTRPGHKFGLGVAVITEPASASKLVSVGTYYWGGSLGTRFWIDPEEELIAIILAQVRPYRHLNYIAKFRALVYASLID